MVRLVRNLRNGLRAVTLAVLVTLPATQAAAMGKESALVLAAASLKTVLDQIAAAYAAQGGATPVLSYAGSSALAKQVEAGAPADVVILASEDWMDWLVSRDLVQPGSRRVLAKNALVVVAHGADQPPMPLTVDGFAARLGGGRLAMALVEAVPAGQYGKAALQSLGLWDSLAPQVAQTDNVRMALALVDRGEAPLGIVYETDAGAGENVSIVARFDPANHPPIAYPAAAVAQAPNPGAGQDFLDFLSGDAAREIWRANGFLPAPGAR